MSNKIYIRVNDEIFLGVSGVEFNVRENDTIVIILEVDHDGISPKVYLEDYKVEIHKKDQVTYESNAGLLFRECFGLSRLRVYFDELIEPIILIFNVYAKKVNSRQIEEMINYLFRFNEKMINLCFSRTTFAVNAKDEEYSDPETILTVAEQFLNKLLEMRLELHYHLRKRLVPIKSPMWDARQSHIDIEPYDVLYNLDNLMPVPIEGDVVINGRLYSVEGVDITTLRPVSDVEENAILLGAFYSIRRKVTHLLEQLHLGFNEAHHTPVYDVEYESINHLLIRVTSGGMLLRCQYLLEQSDELIRYFQDDLNVIYRGELRPKVTPYVRGSRVYRVLFEQLAQWYELGLPSLDGLKYLIKLKSVSKIYEIFTLFKIIEYFYANGWHIASAIKHKIMDDAVPSQVSFEKHDLEAILEYEPKILPFTYDATQHLDIVDIQHSLGGEYSYWLPDFVLKLSYKKETVYTILDAKYSYLSSVINYALPEIYRKYVLGLSVFDDDLHVFDSARILGVLAIYPESDKTLSYWPKYGISARIPRLPLVGAMALSPRSQTSFDQILNKIIEISVKKLGGYQ
ncbi:hypothetical protein KBD45_07515 [Candidatus Dojkabacteria bacterium]|jgi:hypothetical protein|nr:hypothetical protein [Candidatus Dojkabacteria bacterium]